MFIQRVITVYQPELEKLPTELAGALSEEDRRAISQVRESFDALAKRAERSWLREILLLCAACDHWHLEFYGANAQPLIPYFRFHWGGGPAVCLSREIELPIGLPPLLRHFYSVLGGFQENQFGYAGGINRLEEIKSVEAGGYWVAEASGIDPAGAMVFLTTLDGGCLCYLADGNGAWLQDGEFAPVDLEAAVAKYFEALLEGHRS